LVGHADIDEQRDFASGYLQSLHLLSTTGRLELLFWALAPKTPPSVELPMVGQAAFCSSPAAQPPCLINNCTQIGESSSWPVTLRSRAHKHIYLRGHFPSFVFSRCTAPSSVLLLLFRFQDTLLRRDFLLSSLAICLVCRLSLLRLMVSSIGNLLVCLSTMSGSSLRRAIRLLA
jgi:hypothetical protein